MLEGLSILRYVMQSHVTMRQVQIISRKGQWKKISTGILRDYMPDSNEMFVG